MHDSDFMRDVLQRIATGPTLSKDLSQEDAFKAMRIVLEGRSDDVQAAIFLIALRMKRETDDELTGILQAINHGVESRRLAIDHLLTLIDPYDGYLRCTPVAPFLPAVLSACGQRVVTHGVLAMGPKFGATHESVLQAAGMKMPDSLEQVANCLEADGCGWAYVSQGLLAPELAALADLRTRIVKRPCLTTIEVAINRFAPRVASHLVTGFVHKPYPPVYAMLAEKAGFSSATLIRGVEGGIVPSLTQSSRFFSSEDGLILNQTDIDPQQLGIVRQQRAVPLPEHLEINNPRSVKAPGNLFAADIASHAAQLGLSALAGKPGYSRDSLIYSAAVILSARGLAASLADAAGQVSTVLDDGTALAHFRAAAPGG